MADAKHYYSLPPEERSEYLRSLSAEEREALKDSIYKATKRSRLKSLLEAMKPDSLKSFLSATARFLCLSVISIAFFFVVFYSVSCMDERRRSDPPRRSQQQSSRPVDVWSAWDGSNRQLVARVKANLKDPGSLKIISTSKLDEGQYVYVSMDYTATNSFGARIRGKAIARCDAKGNVLEVLQYE